MADSGVVRLMFYVVLSIGLMLVDRQTDQLQLLRRIATLSVKPIQDLATLPAGVAQVADLLVGSRLRQYQENAALRKRILALQARLQRFDSVQAENTRLNQLLAASQKFNDRILLAQLVSVSLDPFIQRVLINRGQQDGVYDGQPVIDTDGVMGQVTETRRGRSVVTLITDPGQAIPVQVLRTGLRAIVHGTGLPHAMQVPTLDRRANIRRGDLLVTSGMGGRYPPGYPVARVTEVVKDANEAFLGVTAEPVAKLNHSRDVLLVWYEPAAVSPAPVASRIPSVNDDTAGKAF